MKKIFTICICIILVLIFAGCSGSESGFEGTKWGMTLVEVNDSTSRLIHTDTSGNAYADEDIGKIEYIPEEIVEATVINYYFGKDKGLTEVVVSADPAPGKTAYDVKNDLKKYYDDEFKFKESSGNTYRYETDFGSLSFTVTDFGTKICFSEK